MCGRIVFCLDGHEVRLLANPCLDLFVPQPQEVDRPTLTSLFRRAGYQSVGLYPALSWDWSERAYYGFDLFLDGRDLDYRGPPLGYWKIPDQFSLARFDQLQPVGPGTPPRFLFFPTITSHLPFGPVPPYQSDWNRLLTPDPFGAAESKRLLTAYIDWLDMLPNYVGMFDYTYRWLGGYLQQPEPRESVMLWVGDPPAGCQRQRRGCDLGGAGARDHPRPRVAGAIRRTGLPSRPGAATSIAGRHARPDGAAAQGFRGAVGTAGPAG